MEDTGGGALGLACGLIADVTGTCPYDYCWRETWHWQDDCERRCEPDIDMAECWQRYFEEKAG